MAERRRRRRVAATLTLALLSAPAGAAAQDADVPVVERIAGDDRLATAVEVSRTGFDAAATVVLARSDDFPDALAAGPLAASLDAPLLLTPTATLSADVLAEVQRLRAGRVVMLGGEAALGSAVATALADAGLTVHRLAGRDRTTTAALVARAASALFAGRPPADVLPDADGIGGLKAQDTPDVDTVWMASAATFPDALAAGPVAARGRDAIVLTAPDEFDDVARLALEDLGPDEVVLVGGAAALSARVADAVADTGDWTVQRVFGEDRLATASALLDEDEARHGRRAELLAVASQRFPDALAAAPFAATTGAGMLLVDDRDAARGIVAAQRDGRRVTVVGGPAAVQGGFERELRLEALGVTHPAGGTRLFPDHFMVAYYGNATSDRLGVLGETTPEQAGIEVTRVAQQWSSSGRTLLPTFELIVSVAQASAGADGDYSAIGPLADVQSYLDVARDDGIHLVLDLQPGRTDFLTQARVFDRFLAEPDVHLALDPEWRMGPGQVPGNVVGSVGAAEVQQVIDHVAAIVRDNDLPQKLVVVHQFRTDMISDRDAIVVPPEVALMVHVDGFGTRSQKLATYDRLTGTDAGDPFAHGFKLFYDEDVGLMSPAQVLALEPAVDLVSYQ